MTTAASLWASLPQITHVHASGDGRWAFWCWAGMGETEDVWCAPTDGSGPPERLTEGQDHFLIRDVSRDGMRLILAQSIHSNEHDHLLLLDRRDGSLRQLTPTQDTHYVFGGRFTADERLIIFTSNFDYLRGEEFEGVAVWKLDLASGVFTELARAGSPFETGPLPSPSRRQWLWTRHEFAPGGDQLWVLNEDGSDLREVLNLGPTNHIRADWLDEDRLAVVADVDGRDRVGVLTLSSGQMVWLAGEPQLFPHDVLPGEGGRFACIVHDQSWTRAVIFGPNGDGQPLANSSGRRSLLPLAALPDGGWLAEAYDADAPHELVRVLADGSCLPLARAEDEPGRLHLAPEDFRWTGPDGLPMQGWLYRPEGTPRGLIAYVHGGPTWHSEDWVNPKIGFWVQSGFAVLDSNYRGSTGFGFAHREAVKDDGWGGREQADIRAGIEAALAAGIPGPVAVAGNSYGGFSSWVAITRHADLVTAAIPMCGMYKLDIDYHATEMPWGRAYSEEMMGGSPEEFPEKYANASPGNFIGNIRGHVMVVHGLADSNVGPENTHVAIREMTEAGIPHEVMLFGNEGHGVFRRSNVETYLERSLAFLNKAFAEGMR